jgi:gluconate kinase
MDLRLLEGWVPIRIYWQESQAMVDWCYVGTRRFSESFFEHTIQHLLWQPFNLLFRHQTPIETLAELQDARPGLPPSGFIFHMSRCGSTLAAQMLAALPQNIVLSEAPLIDTVLRSNQRDIPVTEEQRVTWLRGLIGALGQVRNAGERHLFIKFDSWSLLDLPVIRRAFPETPWIFLYRDPVEVMVSQVRQRGSQMVPGVLDPRTFGLDFTTARQISLEEYCARALAAICEAATRYYEPGVAQLVHYRQLPEAVWSTLAGSFGVCYSGEEVERMRTVAQFDAKNTRLAFEQDSTAKQQLATAEVRALAEQFVRPWYDRLEALRNTIGVSHVEEL